MAAPARHTVKALDKSSLLYKIKRWYYYKCYFPEIGLRKDDTWMENPVITEALRRIPKAEFDARTFRIMRANQLSMNKQILPKDQWTNFDEDTSYLMPYVKEVEKEMEEKKQWESA